MSKATCSPTGAPVEREMKSGPMLKFNNKSFWDGLLLLEYTNEATLKYLKQPMPAISPGGRPNFTVASSYWMLDT